MFCLFCLKTFWKKKWTGGWELCLWGEGGCLHCGWFSTGLLGSSSHLQVVFTEGQRCLERLHFFFICHLFTTLPTKREKSLYMDITRWPTPKSDWSLQPKMEKLSTVSKNKTRSWLWLRSWTPYCQTQTKVEENGENTRPFRYDLNQIPYDYTLEEIDLRD